MGNRKLVPAALHSELTEYSSLIRALRASNTLDIASHLAKAGPGRDADSDRELGSNDDDDDYTQESIREYAGRREVHLEHEYDTDTMAVPPTSSVFNSRDVSPSHEARSSSPKEGSLRSGSRKRKTLSSSPPKQRRRDAWTRWPLLADDVHMPEWSFEDEIGHLAERTLKRHPRPQFPPDEGDNQGDDSLLDLEDIETDPSYLPHLTHAATNHLSTILALLVAHTPNRPNSQQNRIEPMNWRAVLDVLGSCGDPSVADPKMISSVKARMEALYDAAELKQGSDHEILVAHRIQRSQDAKQKLNAELSTPMESLLAFPEPPMGWTTPTQQRPTKKARKPLPKTRPAAKAS
ncbi:hypothetical protein DXG01_008219 [Tephrocybe rancida]|nr:hypothetical protein DXG01_008219 [Tephrocybe rancida]